MSRMNDYANLGTAVLTDSVGWAPTLTWDKMREINAAALALDNDVQVHVTREAFRSAWSTWLKNWREFFAKYDESATAKLGAAFFYPSEIDERVESYRKSLEGWYQAYQREVRPDGTRVPSPTAPPPPAPLVVPDGQRGGSGLPWWLISLVTVGVLGAGVYGFFVVRNMVRGAKKATHTIDERVLPGLIGPEAARAAAASRDPLYYPPLPPARDPYYLSSRDPSELYSGDAAGYLPPHDGG